MKPQKPSQPVQAPDQAQLDDDEPIPNRGRGLGLRLLALLGALSFVMLGLSSLAPLLYPQPGNEPAPEPRPAPAGERQDGLS
jgi:hypothetical protein